MTRSITVLILALAASFTPALSDNNGMVATIQEFFVIIEGDFSMACGRDDLSIINTFVLDAINTLMVIHEDHIGGDLFFDSIEPETETLILAPCDSTNDDDDDDDDNNNDHVFRRRKMETSSWFKFRYAGILKGSCNICGGSSGGSLFNDASRKRRGLRSSSSFSSSSSSSKTFEELLQSEMSNILASKLSHHNDASMIACFDQVEGVSVSFHPPE